MDIYNRLLVSSKLKAPWAASLWRYENTARKCVYSGAYSPREKKMSCKVSLLNRK